LALMLHALTCGPAAACMAQLTGASLNTLCLA
jgi:hypothetical protein